MKENEGIANQFGCEGSLFFEIVKQFSKKVFSGLVLVIHNSTLFALFILRPTYFSPSFFGC